MLGTRARLVLAGAVESIVKCGLKMNLIEYFALSSLVTCLKPGVTRRHAFPPPAAAEQSFQSYEK